MWNQGSANETSLKEAHQNIPVSDFRAKEELGAIGVLTGVGHGQDTFARVLELEVLISKLLPIDGLATGSITSGEITSL